MTPSWSRRLPGKPTSTVVLGEVLQSFKFNEWGMNMILSGTKKERITVTHLTSPLENKSGLWNCTVVFKTSLVRDLDSLVHSSDASQSPEISPVQKNCKPKDTFQFPIRVGKQSKPNIFAVTSCADI